MPPMQERSNTVLEASLRFGVVRVMAGTRDLRFPTKGEDEEAEQIIAAMPFRFPEFWNPAFSEGEGRAIHLGKRVILLELQEALKFCDSIGAARAVIHNLLCYPYHAGPSVEDDDSA